MYTKTMMLMNLLNFLSWLSVLAESVCLQYYFGRFMEKRSGAGTGAKCLHGALVIAANVVLHMGKNWLLPSQYIPEGDPWHYLAEAALNFGIAAVLAVCFYRKTGWRMLFAVVTYEAVIAVCGDLVSVLSFFPSVERLQNFLDRSLKWGDITWEVYLSCVVCMRILSYVLVTLLYWLSLRYIVRSFREKGTVIFRSELLFLLMPSLIGLLMRLFLYMVMWSVAESSHALYEKSPPLLLVIPAILVLILLSILHGVKLFQDIIQLGKEKNNRAVLEKQIVAMQEHIRETERLWSGIRSLKHDMRNALAVAERLAAGEEDRKDGELKAYLTELNHAVKRLESRFQTGSAVADILLDMKFHDAVGNMPDLVLDADRLLFPDTMVIQSYDIGVILSNALDNAVEACRRLREKAPGQPIFIRLSSCWRGKMFLIETENSFDGTVIREEGQEFPITNKSDGQLHGIGLANIKKACEKYYGAVEWEVEGNIFILSVMLKNQEAKEEAEV